MAKRCRSCCVTATPCGFTTLASTDACATPNFLPGVAVSLTLGGVLQSSGTTAGVLTSITKTASGSGYTSAPTVTISAPGGGGTTATATCTVFAGAVNTITITSPGSGYTSIPTISFTGGAGSGATATAVMTAQVALPYYTTGSHVATYSKAGYWTTTGTNTETCPNNTTHSRSLIPQQNLTFDVFLPDCPGTGGIAGTVTIADTATMTTLASGTTTGGHYVAAVPNQNQNPCSYTISGVDPTGRIGYSTDVVTSSPCATGTISHPLTQTPITPCLGTCPYPLLATIHLTDPVFGAITLTYNGVSAWTATLTTGGHTYVWTMGTGASLNMLVTRDGGNVFGVAGTYGCPPGFTASWTQVPGNTVYPANSTITGTE